MPSAFFSDQFRNSSFHTITRALLFLLIFVALSFFLAFSCFSSPWTFTDVLSIRTTTTSSNYPSSSSILSHTSQFSSIYYCLFPSSSSPANAENRKPSDVETNRNLSEGTMSTTHQVEASPLSLLPKPSPGSMDESHRNNPRLPQKHSSGLRKGSANVDNSKVLPQSDSGEKNIVEHGKERIGVKGLAKNSMSSSPLKNQSIRGINGGAVKQGIDEQLIKGLMACDMFDGEWVRDDSYPLYKPGSCPLIDEQFNCFLNGRPDNSYYKLKWKPRGCTLPRLDGTHMLELLRGKRLVFVGDSLNRNMWESLICILRNSVKDKNKVYEQSHRINFRSSEVSFSFVFQEYNCTVELFVTPFLVEEWEVTGRDGAKKETLRLDMMSRSAEEYKNADIIVFNSGHWWTHEKTSTGKDYYQEGSHVYPELNVVEAFRKALTTWGRWIDAKVDPMQSLVFFRGYSASHFIGGEWNAGGQCDRETEPINSEKHPTWYPPLLKVVDKVLNGMKTEVSYMNVTRMTDYRKDGHPSIYRKRQVQWSIQDCSHWCLPGVPDAWNEILYAQLLLRLNHQNT